jgi:starvation-inducible DNA-binding protein
MSKTSKIKVAALRINIGISDKNRANVAAELSKLLADSYTLYLMTHNFQWNVTGPHFNALHTMFMTQHSEEWNALDAIAERIHALGLHAPGTYREYGKLSSIKGPGSVPDAMEMVRLLVKGNKSVAKTARAAYEKADAVNDQPTADILDSTPGGSRKKAWMLRSLLQ